MSLISIPNTFSAGAVIIASQHNSNFSTIYSDYNGNIQNVNIASGAAIAYSKLALTGSISNADLAGSIADSNLLQITTASKVSGTAITGLASLPAGAGVIPTANLPSLGGIPNNIQVFTSSGTWTKPAGVSNVYVKVWGAGGGGGGGSATSGGTSSFAGSTTIQATGGTGGQNPNTGGTGSNGTINLTGGGGGKGAANSCGGVPPMGIGFPDMSGSSTTIYPASFGYAYGGFGGTSALNGGGAGGYSEGITAVSGNVTVTVGIGGNANGTAATAGANGLVIVYY